MIAERPLVFLPLLQQGTLWRGNKKEKAIYLTFDDGPTPRITTEVLDILDRYGIKATFFCIGKNVEKHPDIYQEILQRGHQVGNHTHTHLKGMKCFTSTYLKDIEKASTVINSTLFRPPYGQIRLNQIRSLGKQYKVVLWDLVTRDYNPKLSPEYILRKIKTMTRNGSIIIFHDSVKAQKNLFAVLPSAIEFWQKEGYEFKLL